MKNNDKDKDDKKNNNKILEIIFMRHAKADKTKIGGLSDEGRANAALLSNLYVGGQYFDTVCCAQNLRCLTTAQIVGGRLDRIEEGLIMQKEIFNDIEAGESLEERLWSIFIFLRPLIKFSLDRERTSILIVTSANMVSAIREFSQGRAMPKDPNDLPIVYYLDKAVIEISFRT